MTLKTHLLALAGVALVAFVGVESPHFGTLTFMAGLIGLVSIAALLLRVTSHRAGTAVVVGAAPVKPDKLLTSKRVLIAMLALGIAAYVGGGSTFSSFNAETANIGNSAGTGTLTMSDTVGANTCNSFGAVTLDNTNNEPAGYDANACSVLFNLTNVEPGVVVANQSPIGSSGGQQAITIANTGSLDASKLDVSATYVNAVLSTTQTTGSKSSLPVASLEGPIVSGDVLSLSYGPNTQNCTASGPTAAGAVSITVTGCTLTYAYPAGTRILDTSSDKTTGAPPTPLNTDCYDKKSASAPVAGATYGGTSGLTFNNFPYTDASGNVYANPLCQSAMFYIQEATPFASATLTATSNGGSSPYTVNASTTSLTFSGGLTGAIKSGDKVVVTDTTVNAQATCTANAAAASGATTVTVAAASCTPNVTSFTSSNTKVTDAYYYCWYGAYYSGDQSMCYAPVEPGMALTATSNGATSPYTINASTTSLSFSGGIDGNIRAADALVISDATTNAYATCTVGSSSYYTGATSIVVTGCSVGTATFTTANTKVYDTTAMNAMVGQTTTISNFDTSHSPTGLIELKPLGSNGTPATSPVVELNHHSANAVGGGDSRTFDVGVFLPGSSGTGQNYLQALQSTFGLKWHIDQ